MRMIIKNNRGRNSNDNDYQNHYRMFLHIFNYIHRKFTIFVHPEGEPYCRKLSFCCLAAMKIASATAQGYIRRNMISDRDWPTSMIEDALIIAILQIIAIDIILGGDNAIIIALACRNLPARQKRLASSGAPPARLFCAVSWCSLPAPC